MAQRRPPVWLMGLANLSYGLYGGVVAFAVPQLLGARNIPEPAIASLTAVAFSPGFWAFLLSPVLDVRFTRRWYATSLTLIAALTLFIAFINLDHLILLEATLTIGFCAAYLYQSALGGWLSTITTAAEENTLSVWITIANIGGFGLMAVFCNQLVRNLPPVPVAAILAASVLAPTPLFLFMPAPARSAEQARRLARESFTRFFADLVYLLKRRQVLIAIMLFIAPAGTFSLTNFLGSRGADFHASPGFVGLIGGAGVALGGVAGCLLFPPLGRLLPLRPLYLTIGAVGALFTLSLILLPHTPASFAIAIISVNLFQALAITNSMAIIFEAIGRDNPLASTTFCFISSAYGVPISYMLYIDALGYTRHGIAGSFAVDAILGLAASLLLGAALYLLSRRTASAVISGV